MTKELPAGVKAVAILYYIFSVLLLIGGILSFFAARALSNPNSVLLAGSQIPGLSASAGSFITGGILMIVLSVFIFFVARGLQKRMRWARIAAIVLSCLGVLTGLFSILQGKVTTILSIAFHAAIGSYLLFSTQAKSAFIE